MEYDFSRPQRRESTRNLKKDKNGFVVWLIFFEEKTSEENNRCFVFTVMVTTVVWITKKKQKRQDEVLYANDGKMNN